MSETVQCWLVERDYDDRDLITLVYATPDGCRIQRSERAAAVMRQRGGTVTAAVEVAPEELEPVEEPERRERYAAEAERMAEQYDPDEEV